MTEFLRWKLFEFRSIYSINSYILMFDFNVDLVHTRFMPHTVSTCPTMFVTTCPNAMFFSDKCIRMVRR